MNLENFIKEEDLQLKKLEELIKKSISEEELISSRLMSIDNESPTTFGDKVADKMAAVGGSWTFIGSFFLILATWIATNVLWLNEHPFDPYPFILLNLVLSCLAAIQAPIIMMSQNRKEEKDRKRARNDYVINMKAEIEIRSLHNKVDLLLTEQMKSLFRMQEAQLILLEKISERVGQ
ncbi:MAG: DUF1003 domain-containing protein [Proteobacteria bacterium]|nr:DUF1003 domain-containing protein [Pseudomonadota bacterium]